MKFSLAPPSGPSAFEQWKDAMKAVNRLPMGIPTDFRKKVWLSLADHYIRQLKIDWQKTVRLAFNDRSNPDDDKLGMQIVKDLHRTGCSSFSGQDNEQDRAVLKRVLLAYARWNKRIGYCQGFNVIVALLLNVMERKEDDALKVMIYLIDHVLPESYFDNNLRALSVDMAVFRDLLRMTLPTLSSHLDRLQHAAQDVSTGACYEPPLTNVFTMQWFLTLFATCLPKEVVLRVWDAILLEGSQVLLRTALCLWGKLARRIMSVDSADEFYSLMGELSSDMMEGVVYDGDDMIKAIYAVAPFPFPQLTELREKYTYNIRPFSMPPSASAPAPNRRLSMARLAKAVVYSDEEEPDEEELRAMALFPGMGPAPATTKGKSPDISVVGPGVFGAEPEAVSSSSTRDTVYMERMSTDITALKMQYDKLRLRQRQAHVIITAVTAKKAVEVKQNSPAPVLVPKIDMPLAMNHLFVGKVQGRNRLVTKGPCIAEGTTFGDGTPTKPVHAQTTTDAATGATAVSNSCLSASAEKEAVKSQKLLHDSLEEPLQISGKGQKLCALSSLEHINSGDEGMSGSACSASEASGFAAGVSSGSQCSNRLEKQCHVLSQSEDELSALDSKCVGSDTDCQRPHSLGSAGQDRTDAVNNDHDPSFQHTLLSGRNGYHLSQVEECANKALSSPRRGTASHVQSDHLRCRNSEETDRNSGETDRISEETERDSRAVPCSPKKEQPAYTEFGDSAVYAKKYTAKTGCAADKEVVCGDSNRFQPSPQHMVISRSLSLPTPSTAMGKPLLLSPAASTPTHTHLNSSTAASTPTHTHLNSSTAASTPTHTHLSSPPAAAKARHLSSPTGGASCVRSPPRPFNPFPVKHVNTNRARTGLKLGLYTPSTLQQLQGQLRGGGGGGMVVKKASNASS
ncbi:TBC1 domain family member 30-like isoform X2 [Babylonia areolata]